ncbi:hypothetical protein ACE193_11190 [Bernardetia sp. OM2101]|uniref:hypothetical protein n=1 Tax=Bernardetia sp. OM2101 TaxID=3344876 RepID=UPI0035D02A78
MHIFKSCLAYILLLGVALLSWNCVPEDETTRQQTDIFYLIDPLPDTVFVKGQQSITFEIETSDGLNADKISEVTFYKSLESPVVLGSEETVRSEETFLSKTSQIPSEITFSTSELLAGTGYNSEDEIPGGSFWNIRWEVTSSGKTLAPADTTEMRYICPSNMEGRYIATNDFCQTTPLELNIIKDTVSGSQEKYIIPDITANHLSECVGEGVPIFMTVTESCGNIAPLSRVFFGLRWNLLGGTWNEATGTITLRWTDTYTLNGTIVNSTFVRQ